MGQALKMCVGCANPRGCDTCTDLHNWIMERLDAEPVRHGEWVETGFSSCVWWKYRCDKCGCPQDNKHNYCPNCGAKMDGGKQDAQENTL